MFMNKAKQPLLKTRSSQPESNPMEQRLAGKMSLLNAKTRLQMAREKNNTVINNHVILLRGNQENPLRKSQVNRSRRAIKNAYYCLNVIDVVEDRILEMELSQDLSEGFNDIVSALQFVEQVSGQSEKPQVNSFTRLVDQMKQRSGEEDRSMAHIENAAAAILDIDQMVDDEIVEHLLQGKTPDNCLQQGESIQIPYDFDMEINLDEVKDREQQACAAKQESDSRPLHDSAGR